MKALVIAALGSLSVGVFFSGYRHPISGNDSAVGFAIRVALGLPLATVLTIVALVFCVVYFRKKEWKQASAMSGALFVASLPLIWMGFADYISKFWHPW